MTNKLGWTVPSIFWRRVQMGATSAKNQKNPQCIGHTSKSNEAPHGLSSQTIALAQSPLVSKVIFEQPATNFYPFI